MFISNTLWRLHIYFFIQLFSKQGILDVYLVNYESDLERVREQQKYWRHFATGANFSLKSTSSRFWKPSATNLFLYLSVVIRVASFNMETHPHIMSFWRICYGSTRKIPIFAQPLKLLNHGRFPFVIMNDLDCLRVRGWFMRHKNVGEIVFFFIGQHFFVIEPQKRLPNSTGSPWHSTLRFRCNVAIAVFNTPEK